MIEKFCKLLKAASDDMDAAFLLVAAVVFTVLMSFIFGVMLENTLEHIYPIPKVEKVENDPAN